MQTHPPLSNEIELSLFGPGVGECVLIHAGAGKWLIVDSCLTLDGDSTKPVAQVYLESLGADLRDQVKVIAVTHWHDDHCNGAAALVELASSARFVCSAALRHDEFLHLVQSNVDFAALGHTSGISEFAGIITELNRRRRTRGAAAPTFAKHGQRIYMQNEPFPLELWALSPSDQTILNAARELAAILPAEGQMRKLPAVEPNALSTVFLVKSDNIHFLLGADLDIGKSEDTGWKSVVRSDVRPRVLSCAYKVAHHGSKTGEFEEVWTQLLEPNPIAVMTPFVKSSLPRNEDIERLKMKSDQVYCTVSPSQTIGYGSYKSGVERTMKEVLVSPPRRIKARPGHIRIRAIANQEPRNIRIELFDGACRL